MRAVLNRIGLWPLWAKILAVLLAVVVLVGGVSVSLTLRSGFGRTAKPKGAQTASRAATEPSPGTPPAASPTPLAGTLSCRLPISSGQPGSGGFVTFPSAAFAADPASSVKPEEGYGYGLSYDRSAGKWLPVPRSNVSPDGARYTYWDWPTKSIRIVSVSGGSETSIGPRANGAASAARLNAQSWQVIEALDEGVYASPLGETGAGLWLFPWSGSGERQITSTGFWHAVGGGAAWGTVSQSVPEGAANTILRMDRGGGAQVDWFSRPGLQSRVMGFDSSGHAVVQATSKDVTEVWLVIGQGNGTRLLTIPPPAPQQQGPGGPIRPYLQSVVGDDKGVWLATSDGLYISTSARTEKVSTVTGQLGGGCA